MATGIAELDREIGEGVLEWIQVSKDYRRRGLGSYLVLELLWRMRKAARFVTVSGECENADNPEGLYRKCGFAVTTCGMFCESESKLVSRDKKVSVNYPAASWRGINLPTQQAAGY